jgi:hypothetical protein
LLLVIPLSLFVAQRSAGHTTLTANPQLPFIGPAGPPEPATHLLFVSFPESSAEEGGDVTTQIHPLAGNGLAVLPQAVPLFSRPDPPRCQTDAVHAAPDANIPFVVGELWLADVITGAPHVYLAEVDAGRGYAPAWTVDSSSLTFVHRENPEDVRADIGPLALRSNLRQVAISSGTVVTLTHFVDSLVTEPVWSPTGDWLAFRADDAIWLWTAGAEPVQVSPAGSHRHPAWLSLPPGQVPVPEQ